MKHLPLLLGAALACCASSAPAAPPAWRFEYSGGVPDKLVWQTELGPSYYLFESQDLRDWTLVPAFPQPGTGGEMQHSFTPGPRGFFRIIPAAPAPVGMALIPAGGLLMGENGDWYEEGYSSAAQTDPRGPAASPLDQRVVRGGSWGSYAVNCRVAYRSSAPPQNGDYFDSHGFRPALVSSPFCPLLLLIRHSPIHS